MMCFCSRPGRHCMVVTIAGSPRAALPLAAEICRLLLAALPVAAEPCRLAACRRALLLCRSPQNLATWGRPETLWAS
eukprot:8071573-Lingulodinium_polyedra.AAC.1